FYCDLVGKARGGTPLLQKLTAASAGAKPHDLVGAPSRRELFASIAIWWEKLAAGRRSYKS
ncbi:MULTISPECIES: hypothetical protein, partial [unclassified Pseudoxanthomonas]|uniref:hypothetical protein n=1 Tax=unclassified Pseudoxanthomonas TaxID=2645906 RepID=UPI003076FCE8